MVVVVAVAATELTHTNGSVGTHALEQLLCPGLVAGEDFFAVAADDASSEWNSAQRHCGFVSLRTVSGSEMQYVGRSGETVRTWHRRFICFVTDGSYGYILAQLFDEFCAQIRL